MATRKDTFKTRWAAIFMLWLQGCWVNFSLKWILTQLSGEKSIFSPGKGVRAELERVGRSSRNAALRQ